MPSFRLVSSFQPKGDQPKAIDLLAKGIAQRAHSQTLLGVTGSGKTFTMAHVIEQVRKPTLVIAPNKTLAAQLYGEFKELFPDNCVEYFVSYYDYYQPEAYIPSTDTYIEKDASINDEIDKLRHSATRSLLERPDVIVVASVSCIYGLGSPEAYKNMLVGVRVGEKYSQRQFLKELVNIHYERSDFDFHRNTFRVRGDIVEVWPSDEEDEALRLQFFDDVVEKIEKIDSVRGEVLKSLTSISIFPATHYVSTIERRDEAIAGIRQELREQLKVLKGRGALLEAQRLETRTLFDVEMMGELGYCNGIENYSRYLDGRKPGEPPWTLLDYFPKDYLLFIDESHVTTPQIGGMYRGDRSRKLTLVEHGFRLPSALDNRPLNFQEFEQRVNQLVFVSATPAEYELSQSKKNVVEQIIRPTGLVDPKITVRKASHQVEDLLGEIRIRVQRKERVLVTTLTKKMAEDLTEYYQKLGIRVRYLHSDIETLERVEIIRDLRQGGFDVLVGINLLREGLDLPEVSLVAILDADKEGFLRSHRSLIQTCGRAARHVEGEVLMYADVMTESIKLCLQETERRRKIQESYNQKHGITPLSVTRGIQDALLSVYEKDYVTVQVVREKEEALSSQELRRQIEKLKKELKKYASRLEFEKAAELRDKIKMLEKKELGFQDLGISV